MYHKELKKRQKQREDGGVTLQRNRELAEEGSRIAALSGDEYEALMVEGMRHGSKEDWRRSARTFREAIALEPDKPLAYANLGKTLTASGH